MTLIGNGDDAGDLDIHDNPGLADDIVDLRMEVDGETVFASIWQEVDGERVIDNHHARTTLDFVWPLSGSAGNRGGIYNSVGGVMLLDRADTYGNADLNGGAIYNEGEMTVRNACIDGNAGYFGGAICNAGGSMVLSGVHIQHSSATIGGGIFNVGELSLEAGTGVRDGNTALRGGGIANAATGSLAVSDSEISGSEAEDHGGGISNTDDASLVLIDSEVRGNTASHGGGISSDSTQPVTILRSRIEANTATNDGGGLFLVTSADSAVDNLISCSLIADNEVLDDFGGGLWIDGPRPVQIVNATISGNSADLAANLTIRPAASVVATNVTFFSATGPSVLNLGQLTLQNSILDAAGSNCMEQSNAVLSLGHNIATDASCDGLDAPGDLNDTDALLALLADNGGETRTHGLQGFSPVIDAGDASACAAVPVGGVDQRGAVRPFAQGCDIDAHEQGAPIPDVIFSDSFESP